MKISASLLILLSSLAFYSQADDLYWKSGIAGGTYDLINANVWSTEGGIDATFDTFTPGGTLYIQNYSANTIVNASTPLDLGGGSVMIGDGTSKGNFRFNVGSLTGNGTIIVDVGGAGTEKWSNMTRFYLDNNMPNFTGDFILNSGYTTILLLDQAGETANYGNSITVNKGATFATEQTRTDVGGIATKIILNDGSVLATHYNNFIRVTDLEIGDGTARIQGRDDGYQYLQTTISGTLSGGADSVLELYGPNLKNPTSNISKLILQGENDFKGTILVNLRNGDSHGYEVHLENEKAAQFATVSLQGKERTTATAPRAGQAVLSVDVVSATVGGLIGNEFSLVSSTVDTTLTVNNSTDNSFNGIIENGAGLTLNKAGNGTLTLGNANTYTGSTTITAGTLVANNANALGTGDVNLNGGILQLGAGVDSLTLGGNLIFNGGQLTLNAADGAIQQIIGSGTLTLSGGTLLIDMSAYTGLDISVTDFFSGFNNMSALDFANITIKNSEGLIGSVGADGKITFAAIPEPSTAALFALAAFGLVGRRNRKVATVA